MYSEKYMMLIFWTSKFADACSWFIFIRPNLIDFGLSLFHFSLVGYTLSTVLRKTKALDFVVWFLAIFNDIYSYVLFPWKLEAYIWIFGCGAFSTLPTSVISACDSAQHTGVLVMSAICIGFDMILSFVIALKAEESMSGKHYLARYFYSSLWWLIIICFDE